MDTVSETKAFDDSALIARDLGLARWQSVNDVELAARVGRGLPARVVERLVTGIDPEGRHVASDRLVAKSTLHRRVKAKAPLSRDESDRVVALARVARALRRIYHDDQELVLMFLTRKHAMLADRRPIDLAVESVAGADVVLKLLGRLEAGVAV
jgi:putative toxin-antitoxin system antitoxin component (TIGR02293 family)